MVIHFLKSPNFIFLSTIPLYQNIHMFKKKKHFYRNVDSAPKSSKLRLLDIAGGLPAWKFARCAGQNKLDISALLPAPPDSQKSVLDAGQTEDDFCYDHSAWDEQCEGVGWGQVEFVLILIEGPRPAVCECVQSADHQGNKSKRGLKGKETHQLAEYLVPGSFTVFLTLFSKCTWHRES